MGSLFIRIPYEPGFTTDETLEELGRTLQLPPWLENRRREIEQNRTPLTVPDPTGRQRERTGERACLRPPI